MKWADLPLGAVACVIPHAGAKRYRVRQLEREQLPERGGGYTECVIVDCLDYSPENEEFLFPEVNVGDKGWIPVTATVYEAEGTS